MNREEITIDSVGHVEVRIPLDSGRAPVLYGSIKGVPGTHSVPVPDLGERITIRMEDGHLFNEAVSATFLEHVAPQLLPEAEQSM